MKLLADRYRTANPGSKTQVVNYESRPSMKFTPAANATDRRVLHFTYLKAVTKLPVNFSAEELAPIYKMALSSSELTGKLRATFIVLSDDVAKEMSRSQSQAQAPVAGSAGFISAAHTSDQGPSADPQVSAPPVPVVPAPTSGSHGRSHDSRSSRSSSRMEHDRSRSRSPLRSSRDR